MATETGWATEFPDVDGWYWSRRSGPRHVLHVSEGSVAYGSVWMNPVANPSFFENREWLGPISPADFEQLIQLRKENESLIQIAKDALQFRVEMNGPCNHEEYMTRLCTQCEIREALKEK